MFFFINVFNVSKGLLDFSDGDGVFEIVIKNTVDLG